MNSQLLSLTILLPLAASLGIIALGRWPNLRETLSLVTSLALFILTYQLYLGIGQGDIIECSWGSILPGISLYFRIEPVGMLFSLVASFLWMITTVYAIGYMRAHQEQHQTRFYAYFAIAIASAMGIAFAGNLFTLFIFYEVLTLSTYPLVTHAGTDEARRGGRTYLGILLSTSIVFFLLAIIGTWLVTGSLDFKPGGLFTDSVSPGITGGLLVLFIFGIGKAALMPFHRWLPAAMVAPTPVSALLHAVAVVKAGVFTVVKICLYVFGIDTLSQLPSTQGLLYLAGASVLLASLVAMRQDNLKARLAYSTVSQLGYITIGALLATSAGITGGVMHIATHALGKITLFFCAGAILVASHKTEISQMRGLGRQMPVTMMAFFIASLSIIGLPPAAGTWSKWYLLMGTWDTQQWLIMSVLMLSSLLNIAYLLPIPVRAFFAPKTPVTDSSNNISHNISDNISDKVSNSASNIKEAPLLSLIAIVITATGALVLFAFPQALFELVTAIKFSSE